MHMETRTTTAEDRREWEEIKNSHCLFSVADYRAAHPQSPFGDEVDALYAKLRAEELSAMKANPSEYSKDDVDKLIYAGIFTLQELKQDGLITDEGWEALQLDRESLPDTISFKGIDLEMPAPSGCTDVYFFGETGTGKTCLLEGLAGISGALGSNGRSLLLNMRRNGGAFAEALRQTVLLGRVPASTWSEVAIAINGQISSIGGQGKNIVQHLNVIEMSGDGLMREIMYTNKLSLAEMRHETAKLFTNDNRKLFFILVDCSKDKVKCQYIEPVKDSDGVVIDERVRKKYIFQADHINKLVSLFELPENEELMCKVDAIHFIVTKADLLGDRSVRDERARDLLLEKYGGAVEMVRNYCQQTHRINRATNYNPMLWTFSLGKFYFGDVFEYDPTDSMKLVNAISSCLPNPSSDGESWRQRLTRRLKSYLG